MRMYILLMIDVLHRKVTVQCVLSASSQISRVGSSQMTKLYNWNQFNQTNPKFLFNMYYVTM